MFISTQMGLTDAYKVLGVSGEHALSEIRTAYRQAMFENHPDRVADAPGATERAQRINAAWTVVQVLHTNVVSDDEVVHATDFVETMSEVLVGDFYCKLVTRQYTGWFMRVEHVLYLPLEYLKTSTVFPNLFDENENRIFDATIVVIDDMKHEVFQTSKWMLDSDYQRYLREQRSEEFKKQLKQLQDRLDSLPVSKKPSGHAVFKHVRDCEDAITAYVQYGGWRRGDTAKQLQRVISLLGHVTHEIDELSQSDPVKIAVDQIMGSSQPFHLLNLQTVAAINAASVRTGGFIEPFAKEDLRDFYRQVLEGESNPLQAMYSVDMHLEVEDHAPADLLSDPELEPAPESVMLSSNKGETPYSATYRYDGDLPLAIVRVPLKVYERHAPAYKKPHSFPELPHDIAWAVEITFDNQVILRGLVGEELNQKLDKWLRARKRSKHAEPRATWDDMLLGDGTTMMFGTEQGGVPPWYVGKNKPGRRR